jgi:hypothetical protein
MLFRRSIILSLIVLSTCLAIAPLPAKAEEGEFVAQDAKAQINVRALANTEAEIVGAGSVGDRVQILNHSNGNDGLRWYRVKLIKSGQSGWVRGDLIRVLGTAQTAQSVSPKPPAPVPLPPPRLSASAKSVAPAKPAPVKVAAPLKPKAPPQATVAASPAPADKATPPTPANNSAAEGTATIVSFQTPTYAVRVFSEAGQLRLNLFNRKRNRLALKAVSVESKNSGEGTTYHYGSELKVIVLVPLTGQPTLTTEALGDTVQEQPEAPVTSTPPQ